MDLGVRPRQVEESGLSSPILILPSVLLYALLTSPDVNSLCIMLIWQSTRQEEAISRTITNDSALMDVYPTAVLN
ncbi:hypothetical protein BV22DRAFT_1035017 [Leucogyrophana mollusca]|uniref:Uncharacterized protein n=1 Tax=Leucogyrophana mollusca TaxID=85980 RepID=A0ACB8BFD7_9AGAM|nr:hypothetical protein BV22DRAFT_1035017 [Leucogyrophana mollusca]